MYRSLSIIFTIPICIYGSPPCVRIHSRTVQVLNELVPVIGVVDSDFKIVRRVTRGNLIGPKVTPHPPANSHCYGLEVLGNR